MKFVKVISLFLVYVFSLNFFYTDKTIKVVIDAGHGGKDNGTVTNVISEKDIVFSISKKIKALENKDIEIILLRENDKFIPLEERVKKINSIEPDLVLSLHLGNSGKNSKSSTKAYIYKSEQLKTSHQYATKLLDKIGKENADVELANFYILKNSNPPAINLSLGNLSNEEDSLFYSSDVGQTIISKQIFEALQETKN